MTAGRDLTAADVEYALSQTRLSGYIAARLNRIARAGDDEPRQPRPDPHGKYGVADLWDHPGWPLVSRIVAIATDSEPRMPDQTDGVDNAVTGLLADQTWVDHVAMADVMGLVGDWGVEDVQEAVTNALHEYPRLRAGGDVTAGQDEPQLPDADGWTHHGDLSVHLAPAAPAVDTAAPDPLRAPVEALLAALDAGQRGRLPASIADAVAEVRRHLDGPARDEPQNGGEG